MSPQYPGVGARTGYPLCHVSRTISNIESLVSYVYIYTKLVVSNDNEIDVISRDVRELRGRDRGVSGRTPPRRQKKQAISTGKALRRHSNARNGAHLAGQGQGGAEARYGLLSSGQRKCLSRGAQQANC